MKFEHPAKGRKISKRNIEEREWKGNISFI
jgi:hypothetical protein